MKLASMKCEACEGGTKPFDRKRAAGFLRQVKGWKLQTSSGFLGAPATTKRIEKEFLFKNFLDAVKFVNKVAKLAESEGHHPDILLYKYKHLRISIYTHSIGGLSVNDFILAAKIDVSK